LSPARIAARQQWQHRIWREFHAHNLHPLWRDVLLTLAGYCAEGTGWPAHATLAARARCCTRTVQRALQAGRRLGLVQWTERRARAAWRWLRTSNAYTLILPPTPVGPGTRGRRLTTGLRGRGGESKQNQEAERSAVRQLQALGFPVPAWLMKAVSGQ
jgi:hypothetical protein